MTETEDRDFVVRYCAGRDVACPTCHYNLRDLTTTVCPECGNALTLNVIPRLRYGPYILTLFSITLCAGCGLPWWIYPPDLDRQIPRWLADYFVGFTWCSAWIALGLLVVRRWFLLLSLQVQWAIAVVSLGLMLAVVLIQWGTNIFRLFL